MSSSIEDVLYKAHNQGKRKLLLESIPRLRKNYPNLCSNELYQSAFDQLKE